MGNSVPNGDSYTRSGEEWGETEVLGMLSLLCPLRHYT